MARIQKVENREPDFTFPLRITQRKAKGRRGPSIRVGIKDGKESLVVYPNGDNDTILHINGVPGTIDQWQQFFGPLLGIVPAYDSTARLAEWNEHLDKTGQLLYLPFGDEDLSRE